MSSVIKQHNVKILSEKSCEKSSCNCRNKECCPLEGYCLEKCMVYEAKVSTKNKFKLYYGACEGEINLVFTATQNHFEIEIIKPSFRITFGN